MSLEAMDKEAKRIEDLIAGPSPSSGKTGAPLKGWYAALEAPAFAPGDPSVGAAEASIEAARERNEERKNRPLTEIEALHRIERVLARIAQALETSNDR